MPGNALPAAVVEIRQTTNCHNRVHRQLDPDEQETSIPPEPQRRGRDRQRARRGGHADIEQDAAPGPPQHPRDRLRHPSPCDPSPHAVPECELHLVPTPGEPQGKGGDREQEPEVMAWEYHHEAGDSSERPVARQRTAQWLLESHGSDAFTHAGWMTTAVP